MQVRGNTSSIQQALADAKAKELKENKKVVKGVIAVESIAIGAASAGGTYAATGNPFYAAIAGMAGMLGGGFFAAVKGADLALDLAGRFLAPKADVEQGFRPRK